MDQNGSKQIKTAQHDNFRELKLLKPLIPFDSSEDQLYHVNF